MEYTQALLNYLQELDTFTAVPSQQNICTEVHDTLLSMSTQQRLLALLFWLKWKKNSFRFLFQEEQPSCHSSNKGWSQS